MSLRTSPQTGAAIRSPLVRCEGMRIPVGRERNARPTDLAGVCEATPVCAPARNDRRGDFRYRVRLRGAVQRVDVGIDPYNVMRPSTAENRNSLPFSSTVRRGEVTPPYVPFTVTFSDNRRADRVVRPYNRSPSPVPTTPPRARPPLSRRLTPLPDA